MKALVTTIPFAERNSVPLDQLKENGIDFTINPFNRKIREDELAQIIDEYDYLIAGTEKISAEVLDNAKKLKLISRVGIGLDGVDLNHARKLGIKVAYTPEAPAPAVAELTIGLALNCLRFISTADCELRNGKWHRHFGRRIPEIKIGVIGVGRIGTRVIRRFAAFGSPEILVNDLNLELNPIPDVKLKPASKSEIFKECDLITLHVPLTQHTYNMLDAETLKMMKSDSILINTSRGGVVNESDLYNIMKSGHLSMAALDVFEQEPYVGNLVELPNVILTSHMGSMSIDCRTRMEIEATSEVIRYHNGGDLFCEVPEYEYQLQANVN